MVSEPKSSFQVWVTVTDVNQYCVEVRATSEEEASQLVQEVLENQGGHRNGIEYLKTSKGVMGFDIEHHDNLHVFAEVEDVEPLPDEDSALLDHEAVTSATDAQN